MALLVVRNLEASYGPVVALRGVSFDVEAGCIACVLGANGAGKSTLLKCLSGVMDPFKGSVEFDDTRLDRQDADAVARQGVVMVPEGRQVFPFLTVRENLRMGALARPDSAGTDEDMEKVFAWFPRLRERSAQRAGLLSGGEQQMLAIGRGLMARPRLLLLDEPSLGLSPILTKEIFAIVKDVNARTGLTILVVEQNAAIALASSDIAYVMELGRIVAAGTSAEIAAKPDIQEFYLGAANARAEDSARRQRWKRRKTWR